MKDNSVVDKTRQPTGRKLIQVLGPGLIIGTADAIPAASPPIRRSARNSGTAGLVEDTKEGAGCPPANPSAETGRRGVRSHPLDTMSRPALGQIHVLQPASAKG